MLIKNALLALPGDEDFTPGDIRVEDGVITEIGRDLKYESDVFDVEGLYVFPGVIDAHVHFDDPGYTHREDFYHGTRAAAKGGVTTIIDMPCTSVPPVTNINNLQTKLRAVAPSAFIDYGFFGGVSALSFDAAMSGELEKMADNILGIKTYFISGMDTFPAIDTVMLENVLREANKLRLPVLLHAEDPEIVKEKSPEKNEYPDEFYSYYLSRPEEAEIEAVRKAVEAALFTGGELHIVHVGTAEAVKIIDKCQRVTCETAPHYLAFSAEDLNRVGAALKTTPPVKSRKNKQQLWKYLAYGNIDFVASDHAPAPREEKSGRSVWDTYSGIPGTGTMFPFLLSEGFLSGKISLRRFTQIIAQAPARRYGIDTFKGALDIGRDADLVVVDPKRRYTVKGRELQSKGEITPFEGREFFGRVMRTMVRGKWVYTDEEGITGEPGWGNLVTRFQRKHPNELYEAGLI